MIEDQSRSCVYDSFSEDTGEESLDMGDTTAEEEASSGDSLGSQKPVSSIAVKRKAEEEDSSSKKLAAENMECLVKHV